MALCRIDNHTSSASGVAIIFIDQVRVPTMGSTMSFTSVCDSTMATAPCEISSETTKRTQQHPHEQHQQYKRDNYNLVLPEEEVTIYQLPLEADVSTLPRMPPT